VPEFPGNVGHTVVDLTVDDDAAANPRAERETDDVLCPARGAAPPFAENRAVRVVVERGRETEPLADSIAQRHVGPAEIGCQQHDARLGIERSRRADAHAFDFLPGLRNRRLGKLDDAGRDGIRALCRERRLRNDAMNLRAVLGEDPGDEIRSPNVNSDDVAHQGPR